MKINENKIKILVKSKQALSLNITIINNENKLETVQCNSCLRKKITYDGKCGMDIKSKIAQTKQTFYKKNNPFTANTVNLLTIKTLIKNFIWNTVLGKNTENSSDRVI